MRTSLSILLISVLVLFISSCNLFDSKSSGSRKYPVIQLSGPAACMQEGYQFFNGQCIYSWTDEPCDDDMWSSTGNKPEGGDCAYCPDDSTINSSQTGCNCTDPRMEFDTAANECASGGTDGEPCEDNTWSSTGEGPNCIECPDGSNANIDHTGCDCTDPALTFDPANNECTTDVVLGDDCETDDDLLMMCKNI